LRAPMAKPKSDGRKTVSRNKKAFFNYVIEEKFEAGLALLGPEVKAMREGNANLSDAYAFPKREELFLVHCRIGPYAAAALQAPDPLRERKLLLHRRQIDELLSKVQERGYSVIPLELYFKDGFAKVELALCRGKTHEDRREDIKSRETKREVDRAMKSGKGR
jgi:SsrA-binding protein